jgi:protein SCO1
MSGGTTIAVLGKMNAVTTEGLPTERTTSPHKPPVIPGFRYSGISILLLFLLVSSFVSGCSRLPVLEDLSGTNYTFTNQDSARVSFPSAYRGKIVVMSFIYTHCPDICPLTTNNMQHLQDTLAADKLKGVRFVTLTFDPGRDTPSVLKEYAEIRGIKFDSWDFLGGSAANTDSVTYAVGVRYFPNDSTYSKDGQLSYYITHTDKCVLIDRQGRVRAEYSGSQLDFHSIVKDIKSLE